MFGRFSRSQLDTNFIGARSSSSTNRCFVRERTSVDHHIAGHLDQPLGRRESLPQDSPVLHLPRRREQLDRGSMLVTKRVNPRRRVPRKPAHDVLAPGERVDLEARSARERRVLPEPEADVRARNLSCDPERGGREGTRDTLLRCGQRLLDGVGHRGRTGPYDGRLDDDLRFGVHGANEPRLAVDNVTLAEKDVGAAAHLAPNGDGVDVVAGQECGKVGQYADGFAPPRGRNIVRRDSVEGRSRVSAVLAESQRDRVSLRPHTLADSLGAGLIQLRHDAVYGVLVRSLAFRRGPTPTEIRRT